MDGLELIKIHNWTFDPVKKTLKPDITENNESQANVSEEVSLEAKQADLLLCLIQQTGQIVSRDMLLEQVWNNRYVDDTTINATVSRLRKLLGGAKYQYIKTHPKLGYSFCAEVNYIERPKTHYSTKEKILSLKAIKIYATVITVVLFAIVTYLFSISQESDKTLLPKDVKIEPVTYMEGREYASSLSNDGNYLVFTHEETLNSPTELFVKDLITNQKVQIEPENSAGFPIWARRSNKIYYISGEGNRCTIKSVVLTSTLSLENRQVLTSCGEKFSYAYIAVTASEEHLYYVHHFKKAGITALNRMDLSTKEVVQITAPNTNYLGDYLFSLSPDEKWIAFERTDDTYATNLMLLNLETGELDTIIENIGFSEGLTWSEDSSNILFIDDSFSLIRFNIDSKTQQVIYQSDVQIEDLSVINDTELLASIGDRFHSDIAELNIATGTTRKLIESSFKDFLGTPVTNSVDTLEYFVSTRSGSYQIWQKNKNTFKQISKFQHNPYIEDLVPSPNGQKILYKEGTQFGMLDLNSGDAIKLTTDDYFFNDARWDCTDNSKLLFTAKKGRDWHLLSYDLRSKKFNIEAKKIISIQKDCVDNRTYGIQPDKKGIFELTNDYRIIQTPVAFDDEYPDANIQWSVEAGYFYVLDAKKNLYQQAHREKRDNPEKKLLIKLVDNVFRVSGNRLIYNDIILNNTYVGKITM